jgi:hypothetical protein
MSRALPGNILNVSGKSGAGLGRIELLWKGCSEFVKGMIRDSNPYKGWNPFFNPKK